MAIKPHCVICGITSDAAGSVRFFNSPDDWTPPPYVGWANELGVTAPPGVGLFCKRHLRQARRLAHLDSWEAVRRLRASGPPYTRLWRRLRRKSPDAAAATKYWGAGPSR